jgi:hypothetical protein
VSHFCLGLTLAQRRLKLAHSEAISVAAYVEKLGMKASKPMVKQHLAALFDYLTTAGVLDVDPAASVQGPKYVVKRGKTRVLSSEEARKLVDSLIRVGNWRAHGRWRVSGHALSIAWWGHSSTVATFPVPASLRSAGRFSGVH